MVKTSFLMFGLASDGCSLTFIKIEIKIVYFFQRFCSDAEIHCLPSCVHKMHCFQLLHVYYFNLSSQPLAFNRTRLLFNSCEEGPIRHETM